MNGECVEPVEAGHDLAARSLHSFNMVATPSLKRAILFC